jgi:hypothetical protein
LCSEGLVHGELYLSRKRHDGWRMQITLVENEKRVVSATFIHRSSEIEHTARHCFNAGHATRPSCTANGRIGRVLDRGFAFSSADRKSTRRCQGHRILTAFGGRLSPSVHTSSIFSTAAGHILGVKPFELNWVSTKLFEQAWVLTCTC